MGLKPHIAPLVGGVIQRVTSLVMPMFNRNRAEITPFVHWIWMVALVVSSAKIVVTTIGTLPRCGGTCKFQIKSKSEKDNVRSQFIDIK